MPDRQRGTGLTDGPPRWLLITGIAVSTAAVAVVLAIAVSHRSAPDRALVIAPQSAPQAVSPQCRALTGALPGRLGDYQRATVAAPVPPGTVAWRSDSGGRPVVLRCGVDRPADFVVGAPIQVVDAVQWWRKDPGSPADDATWIAVDRGVFIALTLPAGSGPAPIQQVSDAVAATLPAVAISPGPPR